VFVRVSAELENVNRAARRSDGCGIFGDAVGRRPRPKKLGVKDGQRTWHWKMPESVLAEILASGVRPEMVKAPRAGPGDGARVCDGAAGVGGKLGKLRGLLAADGTIWVSWPKKTSGVKTDVTEDVVRAEALPLGLVDVKVCAVDAVWSGLKLVIRKSER
jgi:hypothetical protein